MIPFEPIVIDVRSDRSPKLALAEEEHSIQTC